MDAFESVVMQMLEAEGYWVRSSYKVKLTKEEKQAIGRPSCPRWELDLVAYKPSANEVLVVECKSYLDSGGVDFKGFKSDKKVWTERYKLFNDKVLRDTVLHRLGHQLLEQGLCKPNPTIRLGLAAGNVARADDRQKIADHFRDRGWVFYCDDTIRSHLQTLAKNEYENNAVMVTAKLLLRPPKRSREARPSHVTT